MNTEMLEQHFASCSTREEIYRKIMELGAALPPMAAHLKTKETQVPGCQSVMYLHARLEGESLYFSAASDALISAGLAALLIKVYSGQTPEMILKTPPKFLEELGIPASLSPGRANGLASLYLRIKEEALKCLVAQ